MFLQLAHTKLGVFQASRLLTLECYRITRLFPADERFAMTQQIRRAALSVHLNIAEGVVQENQLLNGSVTLKLQGDQLLKLILQ